MRTFLNIFLVLPEEIRFYIWTLFLETLALDVAQQYRITSISGSVSKETISFFHPRPSHILAASVGDYQHRGIAAADLSSLLEGHREGHIQHVGTILRINLHSILSTERHYLARAKKTLMLALQLRLVTSIELQTWDFVKFGDFHFYECPPFELYLEHFAPILASNPFNIPVTWDTSFQPITEEERDLVIGWLYHNHYNDDEFLMDRGTTTTTCSTPLLPMDSPMDDGWEPNVEPEGYQGWEAMDWIS